MHAVTSGAVRLFLITLYAIVAIDTNRFYVFQEVPGNCHCIGFVCWQTFGTTLGALMQDFLMLLNALNIWGVACLLSGAKLKSRHMALAVFDVCFNIVVIAAYIHLALWS